MTTRIRLCSLSILALLACSFDAHGLGEAGDDPPDATSSAGSTGAGSTGASTTTGPDATSSGASGTGSEAGSGDGTAGLTTTDPTTTDEPPGACGDGKIQVGEACDNGNDNGADQPCTPACTVNVCGDGYPLTPGEACDDGNDDDDDGCSNACALPPGCGDGMVDPGEVCDDGNAVNTDDCVGCQAAACGDGFVRANVESCDDGKESATCNADCSAATCGDMKVNKTAGETCDLGVAKNGVYDSGCAGDCEGPGLSCGDGVVSPPDELCDTALAVPGGSCSETCKQLACAMGRGDCDGMVATGCEVDLKTDADHCGNCDNDCSFPKDKCNAGTCGF